MSLRNGLLGLLAEGPASGYDLAQRFQDALGSVWPAQHPHIYAELGRLERAGLIEVESVGPRGRKAYRITDAGLAAVRRWLAEEPIDHTMRLETLLRSYFAWLLEPEQLRERLAEEQAFYESMAATLRAFAESKDRGEWGDSQPTRAARMAIEAGLRVNEAMAAWATWALEHDPMGDEQFGRGARTR
jgi:DNA-binding PadR family transcriptional regulator